MNKIKLSILGLGILFSSAVFAQELKSEVTKEQRMEKRIDKLSEELELTEDQKVKIIELRKASIAEYQKVNSNENLDEEAKKSALKELREDNKARMAEILTEEQAVKMQAMKEERKADCKKKCEHKEKEDQHQMKAIKKDVKMEKRAIRISPAEK